MNRLRRHFLPFLYAFPFLLGTAAAADETRAVEEAVMNVLPGMKPESIRPSPLAGIYEVVVGPKLFYVSADGKYLIQGTLVDLKSREDLTEPKLAAARLGALEKMGENNMIVFKPKMGKHVAYVFTDIDCGYCRKLHSEIDSYLKEGIEIRYLFFPRAGEGSESYDKAVSVWCAKDRNTALTRAKRGEKVESKTCDNPVDRHMALGVAMGAQGTPMIVTGGGNVLPGYVPAEQLGQMLQYEKEEHKAKQAKAR
ncbi:MAG TPA: DsbC family protein [Methylococcus sp.]|nr:DsbC family protein [Methylococcus sp.]